MILERVLESSATRSGENELKPYSTSAPRHYCRLLPPWRERPARGTAAAARYAENLALLTREMVDDLSIVSPLDPDVRIPAGFTYFGQFVDHDLTNDSSERDDAWERPVEQIANLQSPALDLGVLYGAGPDSEADGKLYRDAVRLRVGDAVDSLLEHNGARRHSFDLAVDGEGRPLAADKRSAETIIIRQLTAVFARLHNAAVEQFAPEIAAPHALFQRARLQTTWQYQWLICNDYLPRVLDAEVCDCVFRRRRPRVRWETFSIPVEFTAAAFRFGHSMVRQQYLLSTMKEAKLREIVHRSYQPGALEAEWEIDWARFFQGAGRAAATTAMPINARVAETMHAMPKSVLKTFNATMTVEPGRDTFNLPLLTLLRGFALALPSGQEAARAFGYDALSEDELTRDYMGRVTAQGEVLRRACLTNVTPLWYYLLKEAEVRNGGDKLGATGSRIVAETIFGALQHDPSSILNHPYAGDEPPEWNFTGQRARFRSVAALLAAVSRYLT